MRFLSGNTTTVEKLLSSEATEPDTYDPDTKTTTINKCSNYPPSTITFRRKMRRDKAIQLRSKSDTTTSSISKTYNPLHTKEGIHTGMHGSRTSPSHTSDIIREEYDYDRSHTDIHTDPYNVTKPPSPMDGLEKSKSVGGVHRPLPCEPSALHYTSDWPRVSSMGPDAPLTHIRNTYLSGVLEDSDLYSWSSMQEGSHMREERNEKKSTTSASVTTQHTSIHNTSDAPTMSSLISELDNTSSGKEIRGNIIDAALYSKIFDCPLSGHTSDTSRHLSPPKKWIPQFADNIPMEERDNMPSYSDSNIRSYSEGSICTKRILLSPNIKSDIVDLCTTSNDHITQLSSELNNNNNSTVTTDELQKGTDTLNEQQVVSPQVTRDLYLNPTSSFVEEEPSEYIKDSQGGDLEVTAPYNGDPTVTSGLPLSPIVLDTVYAPHLDSNAQSQSDGNTLITSDNTATINTSDYSYCSLGSREKEYIKVIAAEVADQYMRRGMIKTRRGSWKPSTDTIENSTPHTKDMTASAKYKYLTVIDGDNIAEGNQCSPDTDRTSPTTLNTKNINDTSGMFKMSTKNAYKSNKRRSEFKTPMTSSQGEAVGSLQTGDSGKQPNLQMYLSERDYNTSAQLKSNRNTQKPLYSRLSSTPPSFEYTPRSLSPMARPTLVLNTNYSNTTTEGYQLQTEAVNGQGMIHSIQSPRTDNYSLPLTVSDSDNEISSHSSRAASHEHHQSPPNSDRMAPESQRIGYISSLANAPRDDATHPKVSYASNKVISKNKLVVHRRVPLEKMYLSPMNKQKKPSSSSPAPGGSRAAATSISPKGSKISPHHVTLRQWRIEKENSHHADNVVKKDENTTTSVRKHMNTKSAVNSPKRIPHTHVSPPPKTRKSFISDIPVANKVAPCPFPMKKLTGRIVGSAAQWK